MTSNTERDDADRTSAIVVALFLDQNDASDAITDLRGAGFAEDDIGIAMQDSTDRESGNEATGITPAEGAAQGALSGGIVGGALGLLGSLLIPGVGPIIAGGLLGTMLAGAGIGAATGGLIGALVSVGVSQEAAEHFDRGFREGGVLVTVRADGRELEARTILRDRSGDLGPSYAASDLTSKESAGAVKLIDDRADEAWRGSERRSSLDLSYAGPERRFA
jgi:hypothetical protein